MSTESEDAPAPANQPPALPRPPGSEDNMWMIFSHISLLLGVGLILPLIVYLMKKDQPGMVVDQAREALNFHISLMIYGLACGLTCVLAPFAAGVALFGIVFAIVAALKVSKGESYRYPLTIRLVK
ncbi:MAG: DUF4870 domain-containing protein [Luteolibacter sp.]